MRRYKKYIVVLPFVLAGLVACSIWVGAFWLFSQRHRPSADLIIPQPYTVMQRQSGNGLLEETILVPESTQTMDDIRMVHDAASSYGLPVRVTLCGKLPPEIANNIGDDTTLFCPVVLFFNLAKHD